MPAVGVAGGDEEDVGDAIHAPHGVGMILDVPGGDEGAFGAARDGAGDVEERAEPAPAGDDELVGELRPSPPLL